MLSTDLTMLLGLSTALIMGPYGGVTTCRVFSLPLCGFPPPPANHPYVITCGTDKTILNDG